MGEEEGKSVNELLHHAYTETNVTYSTLEQILDEIKAGEKADSDADESAHPEHDIEKRYHWGSLILQLKLGVGVGIKLPLTGPPHLWAAFLTPHVHPANYHDLTSSSFLN
jgi:hypothetical protein